ncbi:MAG: geranylgeranylglyceryl/heptaprenylglyceryl phosphate synthase [Thermoplasmata archaeon]|jgi:phosphoglycerol geranylgeranyltransferase|nr:geranylgeranylglyceryl/heptaprenylglyceryl phosphate synthase [Thermoplasmata archaeon]
MTVKQYLLDRIAKGTIHMALIDPDKQSAEIAGDIAKRMKDAGTDAVLIGGSTGVTKENLSSTAKAIKERSGLPAIHFPGGPDALSTDVDGILYMCMMNSMDLKKVMGYQVMAAPYLKKLGIETISMGYVIVEPGMKVGEVGNAKVVKRDEIDLAVAYGLAAEMYGMSLFYLEAGSGADRPVPPEMIRAVKKAISIPLIVGGGIRTPEAAAAAREAGADVIVTGTLLERCDDGEYLKSVVKAAKGL